MCMPLNITLTDQPLMVPKQPSIIFEVFGKDYGINDTVYQIGNILITPRELYAFDIAIRYFMWGVALLVVCLIIHEYAHVYVLSKIKKKEILIRPYWEGTGWRTRIGVEAGTKEDYQNLTDLQYLAVLGSGLVIGAIPMVMVGLLFQSFGPLIISITAGILYCAFIIDDMKNVGITVAEMLEKKLKRSGGST